MRIDVDAANNLISYSPSEGVHSATLILMHGLGDSADGLNPETFRKFVIS